LTFLTAATDERLVARLGAEMTDMMNCGLAGDGEDKYAPTWDTHISTRSSSWGSIAVVVGAVTRCARSCVLSLFHLYGLLPYI
jgi:hypothetical protein